MKKGKKQTEKERKGRGVAINKQERNTGKQKLMERRRKQGEKNEKVRTGTKYSE